MRTSDSSGRTRALSLATVAFMVSFFAWSILGPLGPDLQDHLGLSEFELAVMVALPVLLGSLMRVPLGMLTDRYGGRKVFTALLLYVPLPLVALALWHDSYASMLVFGFLLGFAGASFAVGVPFVNHWYEPSRRGFALGVYGVGMGGTVLSALVSPRIADAWGLAAPFWIAAGLVAVMAVVFYVLARDAEHEVAPPASMLAPLKVFRTSKRAWALTLFYFMSFGGFVALFLYLPKLLTGVHDLTKADAGARAAGFALFAVLARPVGGWLSDRVRPQRVLLASYVWVALTALALAFTYKQMVPLTIASLTVATALGLGTGAVFKLVAEWFPKEVGTVTGVVGAAGGLGGFFPPLVMGIVKAQTGSYVLGFILMAAVGVLCLVVLSRLEPRVPRARRAPTGGPAITT